MSIAILEFFQHPFFPYVVVSQLYIPCPAINIDASVNEAFTADKLNSAKSYFDITDC